MRISNLKATTTNESTTLSASLDSETVVLRYPATERLHVLGDAFVVMALVRAMERGESLEITADIPVSASLLKNLSVYQEVYMQWYRSVRAVHIVAPNTVDDVPRSNRVGCFFSGGVDSVYSVLRHRDEVTDLILCRGLDIPFDEVERWEKTVHAVREFADELKLNVLCIETDAKARFQSLEADNHGAILIATALPVDFSRVIVPASHTYLQLFPWGSHPVTDPLLGTATTQVIHEGAVERSVKTAEIARTGLGLHQLRVCNRYSLFNCGECEKCIRTMTALAILKVESRALPPFQLSMLRGISLQSESNASFWRDNEQLAIAHNRMDIAREIRGILSRYTRRESLRAADERLTGGAGIAALRSVKRLLRR